LCSPAYSGCVVTEVADWVWANSSGNRWVSDNGILRQLSSQFTNVLSCQGIIWFSLVLTAGIMQSVGLPSFSHKLTCFSSPFYVTGVHCFGRYKYLYFPQF
jgi:hypothetical protein